MIQQCGLIFLFLAAGELILWLTDTTMPSSIIRVLVTAGGGLIGSTAIIIAITGWTHQIARKTGRRHGLLH